MTGPDAIPTFQSLTFEEKAAVDEQGEAFRRALSADKNTRFESYLKGFHGNARLVLLRVLMLEEWDYRWRELITQLAGDLSRRLPDEEQFVAAVLAERTTAHTAAAAAATTESEHPRIPGYDVLNVLNDKGSFAVIFRAFDRSLRRDVAVKVLRRQYWSMPDVVQRFRIEAARQSELHDAGVPTVFSHGFGDEACPFIAMELVEGNTLHARLARAPRTRRFGNEDLRLLDVIYAICRALNPAHRHREVICHLDLSPGNVMITSSGRVVILDWGLGRDKRTTAEGVVGGTLNYMAPERARGEVASPASDVFSIGCFLLQLVTGEPIFPNSFKDEEKIRLVQDAQFGDVGARLEKARVLFQVPHELVQLTLDCIAAQPAARPADAGVVAARIDAYRRSAEQERQEQRIKAARRKLVRSGLGLLAAVLLVAGTAGGYLLFRADRESRKAAIATKARIREEGDRLAERGDWYAALAKFRSILAEPVWDQDQWLDLRQRVLRAAVFLNDRDTIRAELEALDAEIQSRFHADRFALDRALFLLTRSMEHAVSVPGGLSADTNPHEIPAVELLNRVRDNPRLPEADRWTARGLLATNAEKAIENYQEALRLQPFHPYAGPYYLTACLLSGQLDRALARAEAWAEATPADPLPWFYKAFILTLLRRTAAADEALVALSRAGGGRVLPLDTVQLCESAIKVVRVIDRWLPESAAAEEVSWIMVAEFVKEFLEALPAADRTNQLVLFPLPLAPNQRRAFGRFIAACLRLQTDPGQAVSDMVGVEMFVAEGTTHFVRAIALARSGGKREHGEAVQSLHACESSNYHLWNVRPIARLCLARYEFTSALLPENNERRGPLIQAGKGHLRAAAVEPGLSENVRKAIRSTAARLGERAFEHQIEEALTQPHTYPGHIK